MWILKLRYNHITRLIQNNNQPNLVFSTINLEIKGSIYKSLAYITYFQNSWKLHACCCQFTKKLFKSLGLQVNAFLYYEKLSAQWLTAYPHSWDNVGSRDDQERKVCGKQGKYFTIIRETVQINVYVYIYSIDRTLELNGDIPRRKKIRGIVSINDSEKQTSQHSWYR